MTLEEAEKEIRDLRDENAKHRLKNKEIEGDLSTAKAERDKLAGEKDGLAQSVIKLTEDSEKIKTESAAKLEETTKAANDKIMHAEVAALAIKEGLVDRDALKLADLSKVELGEDGVLKGADDVIKGLKESKPYLFGKAPHSSDPNNPPRSDPPTDKKCARSSPRT